MACIALVVGTSPPNILMVLLDDAGLCSIETQQSVDSGEFVDSTTSIRTPNIRALSARGSSFKRMYTTSPLCGPSRYALMTGIPTGTAYSRIRGNFGGGVDNFLSSNGEVTMFEVVKKAGYRTAVFGKWGFRSDPSTVGVDYFLGTVSHVDSHYYFPEALTVDSGGGITSTTAYTPLNSGISSHSNEMGRCHLQGPTACNYAPDVIHTEALDYISTAIDDSVPFFVLIASAIPHDSGRISGSVNTYLVPSLTGVVDYSTAFSDYTDTMRAQGSSITNYLDVQVGELVHLLETRAQFNNTLIILTSDNGASISHVGSNEIDRVMYNPMYANGANNIGYKRQLFEGSIRMPNIFVWPDGGIPANYENNNHVVLLSDIPVLLADVTDTKAFTDFLHEQFEFSLSFLPTLISGVEQVERHDDFMAEICSTDTGSTTNRNLECDAVLLFGTDLQHKAEWTLRTGSAYIQESIQDTGQGKFDKDGEVYTAPSYIHSIDDEITNLGISSDEAVSILNQKRVFSMQNTLPNIPDGTPTASPTASPTPQTTGSPTASLTGAPTASLTGAPTASLTGAPTASLTGAPTASLTGAPTASLTGAPTASLTGAPTASLTGAPTVAPTPHPTTKVDSMTFWESNMVWIVIIISVIMVPLMLLSVYKVGTVVLSLNANQRLVLGYTGLEHRSVSY